MADDQKPEEIGVICRPSLTMSEKVVMPLRPLAMQQLIKEFSSYMVKGYRRPHSFWEYTLFPQPLSLCCGEESCIKYRPHT